MKKCLNRDEGRIFQARLTCHLFEIAKQKIEDHEQI